MKGYTLVELLASLFILGILLAIILPSFIKISYNAKETQARLFVSQINRRQQAYFTQYGRFAKSLSDLDIVNEKPTFYEFILTSKSHYKSDVQVDTVQHITTSIAKEFRGCVKVIQGDSETGTPSAVVTELYEYFPNQPIPVNCP